jgi:predicted nuclease of predicted toxin-antitoxin system
VDAVSVTELSPGLKDREVLDLAGREGRIIATFDKDFGELVVRERARVK